MNLTTRDVEIIRLVHRHRFLSSSHVCSLVSGSPQQILRRLNLLYHHGYLERPRLQIEYYHQGGTRPMVYGLGKKGEEYLKNDPRFANCRFYKTGNTPRRVFLDHELLVSDIMVVFELACRKRGDISLIYGEDLSLPDRIRTQSQPFRWRVRISDGLKVSVVPDRVFSMEYMDQRDQRQQVLFFLEADRGTMPVERRSLFQTSFRRKLLGYEATLKQGLHLSRFGYNRFRVITVTTNASRVNSLVQACTRLKSSHGLFLFTDRTVLEKDPFSLFWQTGRPGQTANLFD